VEDYEDRLARHHEEVAHQDPLERIAEQNATGDYDWEEGPSGYTHASAVEDNGPCVRVLEGHSKSVTALYYEDGCLVCLP
jgi:division protein 1